MYKIFMNFSNIYTKISSIFAAVNLKTKSHGNNI